MNKTRLQNVNLYAFLVVGLYLASSLVVSGIVIVSPSFADNYPAQTLIIYLAAFFVPTVLYTRKIRKKTGQLARDTLSFHPIDAVTVLICILLGFLIQPVMGLVAELASKVFVNITDSSLSLMTSMPLWLYILTLGLMPALFEELVCRGMLLDGYRETPLWYQIVIPALFFGLLHLNFLQMSYAFLAGMFLALVVRITNSLWASIVVHFVFNTVQVTVSWLQLNTDLFSSVPDAAALETPSAVVSVLLVVLVCVLLICLLLRVLSRRHHFAERRLAIRLYVKPGWQQGSLVMYVTLGALLAMNICVEIFAPLMLSLGTP